MAGLAYLFLPISGLIAYFNGKSPRMRFHGLQAIVIGSLWGGLLFGCSLVSPAVTLGGLIVGGLVWLLFLLGALTGRDPRLPFIGRFLEAAAEEPPGGSDALET